MMKKILAIITALSALFGGGAISRTPSDVASDNEQVFNYDYYSLFPNKEAAEKYSAQLKIIGFTSEIKLIEESGKYRVISTISLKADDSALLETEIKVKKKAETYGGEHMLTTMGK